MKKLLPFLTILCAACGTVNNDVTAVVKEKLIDPPLPQFDIDYEEIWYSNTVDTTLHFASGTQIFIPANAFVDEHGETIKEKVQILYREFHTVADIFQCGISMKYDSAGVSHDFSSAGMFDFKALNGNKEVHINPNKQPEVAMASYEEGDDYQFYGLSESSENWERIGTNKTENNDLREEKLAECVDPIAPIEPVLITKDDIVLDFNLDYLKHPEMKPFYDVFWKYHHVSDEFKAHENVNFNQEWDNIKVESLPDNQCYKFTFEKEDEAYATTAVPGYMGRKFKEAKADFGEKMKQYETILTKVNQIRNTLKQEAKLLRRFKIPSNGVYNWDKIHIDQNVIAVNANFLLDEGVPLHTVFFFQEGLKGVIKYNTADFSMFRFNPNKKAKLVAVVGNNKFAEFNQQDFEKLKNLERNAHHDFVLHTINTSFETEEELTAYLNKI